MLVLALGLSFGLGAKDTAGEIVRGWYDSVREAKPKLERATSETVRESKEAVQAAKHEYHGSPHSTVAHR